MILFPAIDLKEGQCVRLERGEMDKATVFNTDPADQAKAFEAQGFQWLHLVDLDGAFAGKPANATAVPDILSATSLPCQLGGGIRSMAIAEGWIAKGIKRIILGTAALKDPAFVREAAKAFPGQVAVGIDAKGGFVATEGWADVSAVSALELGKRFEDAGVSAIIYTDIDRDGLLSGVNVDATLALAKALSIPVIASGGVSSLADLQALRAGERAAGVALEGVISGRALYDGRLEPGPALAYLASEAP